MAPAVHVLLSGLLTFGVPLALAWRELSVTRRPPPAAPPPPSPPPRPPGPRGGSWSGTLPACLIPHRQPERVRDLVEP